MCPAYVAGLIGPGERKSTAPLAERAGMGSHDAFHHFIAVGPWDEAALEEELARVADRLVGGPDAYLIVDDTALPKKGTASVGVAPQYASMLGKNANCQTLVSLTLSSGEVPVPVALRLFLPEAWTSVPVRLANAGVPEDRCIFRTKPEIALAEIDRLVEAGVCFGIGLADAGYGISAPFRHGLSARNLLWAVGIPRILKVYPAEVAMVEPQQSGRGRPRRHAEPDRLSRAAEEVLADADWHELSWRSGTKGSLAARFAAVRIKVADGSAQSIAGRPAQHLPGEEAWLVGEHRSSGERKYYLANLAAGTDLKTLASAIKARWSCEQAHQQMKEELGLDHFEGRSWRGLHRHALMTMIATAFLQHRRLAEARRGKKGSTSRRPAQACRPCATPSWQPWPTRRCTRQPDAHTAADGSDHPSPPITCQSSARGRPASGRRCSRARSRGSSACGSRPASRATLSTAAGEAAPWLAHALGPGVGASGP
jgi:SRSO17 transposase